MQKIDASQSLKVLLCMSVSIALAYMGGGIFVYTLPLLLLTKRISSTKKAVLIQSVTYLCALLVMIFPYLNYLTPENYGIIAFSLLFPFVSAVEALVYTSMRDKSKSVLRKMVKASLVAFIVPTAFAVWLTSSYGLVSFNGLRSVLGEVLKTDALGINITEYLDLILSLFMLLATPISMVFAALPILVAEFIQNSRDEEWQFEFANMKMPNNYFWVLCGFVCLTAVGYLVKGGPTFVSIIGWNFGLGLCLHYMLNGFSVLIAFFRRRTAYVAPGRLFVLLILMSLLPALNVVVGIGLFSLGILETWMKFR